MKGVLGAYSMKQFVCCIFNVLHIEAIQQIEYSNVEIFIEKVRIIYHVSYFDDLPKH